MKKSCNNSNKNVSVSMSAYQQKCKVQRAIVSTGKSIKSKKYRGAPDGYIRGGKNKNEFYLLNGVDYVKEHKIWGRVCAIKKFGKNFFRF